MSESEAKRVLTTSLMAKRNASIGMLMVSGVAVVLLSTGYLDSQQQKDVSEAFVPKTMFASAGPLSWREVVGLVGAFLLFLVPVVRNFSLIRLPERSLQKWVLTSTGVWLAVLIWRMIEVFR